LLALSPAIYAQDSTNKPPAWGPPGGHRMRGGPTEMMAKELNLTDDQKAKVKAVFDDQMKQMRDLRLDTSLSTEDKRAKMKTIREDTNAKLKDILTADQFTKWQTMMHQMRERRHGNRNHGSDTNTPPVAPQG
ncbi:MAG: Spy/CpxP family protein refolding chaperone, partial [Limisphaerales bacterium]